MKNKLIITLLLLFMFISKSWSKEMDKMWGSSFAKNAQEVAGNAQLFDYANYAMFVHWGLFSQLANKWKDKTYYGIGEWLMNPAMANIPFEEYKTIVKDFNPKDFDAYKLAKLAKDAGMKYIVITSKHHDGFAMYDSKVNDFNVVKQTAFGRDPMKELAQACKDLGLGFGFYYSHNQDWTYPGGNGGPSVDANGNKKIFDDYFYEKCLPQVNEITTNYGDITLIWFDTPGGMPEKYAKELIATVRKNQPKALISGRVGYDLGDYQTLGDMEVPLKNINGLWESIDVTNDSWGYAWYDENWKSPKQILNHLVATVARGGTFMLNVGPNQIGEVPLPAQKALLSSGKWIEKHPQTIYGAGPSPWLHAMPWGDVTTSKNGLNLLISNWPANGKLYVPGVLSDIKSVKLIAESKKTLKYKKEGNWLVIDIPFFNPDKFMSVIEVDCKDNKGFKVDTGFAVDPEFGLNLSTLFAQVKNGKVIKDQWMEKFGEWKTAYIVKNLNPETVVTWEVEVKSPGLYALDLKYDGQGRLVWKIETDEGIVIQNQQGSSQNFQFYPIGIVEFKTAGKHQLAVSLVEGDMKSSKLTEIKIRKVDY